jgi:hypothetical protein
MLHAINNAANMAGRPYNVGLDEANLSKAELAAKIQRHVPGFYVHFAPIGEDPDKRNYMVSSKRLREAGFGEGEHFAMQAKQTRLNFELRAPTPIGSLKSYYENDFFGDNTEPTMVYRLRHFYGQLANVTVGQTWSTFYDPDSFPDTLDFEGPGMLPDIAEKIFNPFFTTKAQGSGLGLAIVRKIVDAHEGRIDMTTADGRGTKFRVTLPVEPLKKK